MGTDRNALNQISNKGNVPARRPGLRHRRHGLRDGPEVPEVQRRPRPRSSSTQYKNAHGGKPEFALQSTFDEHDPALAQETKRQIDADRHHGERCRPRSTRPRSSTRRSAARSTPSCWRNYPGQDPDTMYVWFYGGSRGELQPRRRPAAQRRPRQGPRRAPTRRRATRHYEDFNKRMSSQAVQHLDLVRAVVHRHPEQRPRHPRPEPARRRAARSEPSSRSPILAGYPPAARPLGQQVARRGVTHREHEPERGDRMRTVSAQALPARVRRRSSSRSSPSGCSSSGAHGRPRVEDQRRSRHRPRRPGYARTSGSTTASSCSTRTG